MGHAEDMSATALGAPVRPSLRGVIHRYAVAGFGAAFVALVLAAPDGAAKGWMAVYGACVLAMFAISAVYHSGRIHGRAHRWFKRIDHSTIFLAIAGSYTGLVGLGLEGTPRTILIVAVWVSALIGIAIRMLWIDAPYPVVATAYVLVGWIALIQVGPMVTSLDGTPLAFVIGGGLAYTAGGVVYGLHRPNPWPAHFGYHEVFHALVALGALLNLVASALMLSDRA